MTQMKIIFIGESESGKTQVINQICNQRFDNIYYPTKEAVIKIWQAGNNRISIQDTPGHDRGQVFTHSYYRDTNTGVFFVDLTKTIDKAKIEYLQSAIQAFKEGCLRDARLILVGTKSDLVQEQNPAVKLAEIQKLIQENQGFTFDTCLPTSAKTGRGIKILQAALMNAPAIELVDDVEPDAIVELPTHDYALYLERKNEFLTAIAYLPDNKKTAIEKELECFEKKRFNSYEEIHTVPQEFINTCQRHIEGKHPHLMKAVFALAATALVSLLVGIVGFGIGFAAGIWTGPGAFISAVLACNAAAVTVATVSSTLGLGAGAYMFFHTDKKASVAIEKLNLFTTPPQ